MSIMHNGEKVLNNLTTVPITQTINASSTEKEIPSAKAVFGSIDNIQTSLTSLTPVTDLDNFKGKSFMIGRGTGYNNECANVPNGITGAFVVEYFPYGIGDIYGTQRITLVQASGGKYSTFERSLDNGNWMGWQKVCTTKVADVPVTKLTVTGWASGNVYYCVKNGICYVHVSSLLSTTMSTYGQVIANGLPKPIMPGEWHTISAGLTTGGTLLVQILDNGAMCNYIGSNEVSYFGSFSYPVASL